MKPMPQTQCAQISNFDEAQITELRQRGVTVTKAYLGDFGYTTQDQTDLVCDAINDLMHDTSDWTPIIWDQLEPETQHQLMLLAADSDTFMEKARLPSGMGHEERINCIIGLSEDCELCGDNQPTDDQVPPRS